MAIPDENSNSELDIALKSTNGDTEKALAMIAGEYFDCAVLKGTFLLQDSGYSGLIVIFFNTANDYIPFIDSVILKTSVVYEQIDASAEWKAVLHEINTLKKSHDIIGTSGINDKILNEIFKENFFLGVKSGNVNQLENGLEVILRKVLGNQPTSCNLGIEQINSLTMSKEGIPFVKPAFFTQPQEKTETEKIMQSIEEQAQFVLEGNAVIAPVKGKFITNVQIGDEILILINDKDQESRTVLTSLNAIDEDGTVSPVPGKIVQKINLPDTRSIVLYALVDKGILVKLTEDSSLKIIDISSMEKASSGEIKIPLGVILFIVAALIIVTVILLV